MNTKIRGLQIADAFLGNGLKRNGVDENIAEVALKANDGLKIDTAELTVAYDNATIGIISNALAVKDAGITEAKLDINSAPTDGFVVYWNNSAGKLDYKEITTAEEAVKEADVKVENHSATCDGLETAFVIVETPVLNSIQIYLNGLLQEEGSGKDYTFATKTATFAVAPEAGDILLIHYIEKTTA